MSTCREIAARATQHLDGELGWSDRLRYWAHLVACASCRRYVRQMRLTTEVLRLLGEETGPPTTLDPTLRQAAREARSGASAPMD
ncbi:MAG: zf-HC2 domain-containing protein [Vicinamibacterales bacterium]